MFDKSTEQRLMTVLVLMLSSVQNKTRRDLVFFFNIYNIRIEQIPARHITCSMFIKAQLTVYELERAKGSEGDARTIYPMYSVHV